MKYWIDDNDLVIKKLFRLKRYAFHEISKIVIHSGYEVYIQENCIIKKDNFLDGWKNIVDKEKFYNLIAINNIIFDARGSYGEEFTEIDVDAASKQCVTVIAHMEEILSEYIRDVLGEGYELIISIGESTYHRTFFFDIYKDGVKMSINDKTKMKYYKKYYRVNGKKEYHLESLAFILPKYISPSEQKYVLVKNACYELELEEVKYEIDEMKRMGMVPASEFGLE